mgnify:FL=1
MDFNLTTVQKNFQQTIQKFANEMVAKEVKQMEETKRFPKALINQMGKKGYMGIPIPEKYGGMGMDYTSYIIAIHEISKVSASVGAILSVHTSVGTNPILHFGNEEQKNVYLPKLASGQFLGAFALTEANAGSDAANLKTKAKKDNGHYILNGSKTFITNGKEADTFIVFARTSNEGRSKGISAFIIEKDTPGFIIGKEEKKMGLHGTSTVEIIFDDCKVAETQRLGDEGDGFRIAMANLNAGRIGIAAQALGIAEGALEQAINYLNVQKQYEKALNYDSKASLKLENRMAEVEAAKLLTYRAAMLIDLGESCRKEVSMAKMYASKTAMKTAHDTIHIFGTTGVLEDDTIGKYFRDAKVTEIYEGTTEIQHIVIAKELLR